VFDRGGIWWMMITVLKLGMENKQKRQGFLGPAFKSCNDKPELFLQAFSISISSFLQKT